MDWQEALEDFWNGFKDRIYYILFITLVILAPFILLAPGLPSIPVLSEIYALGRGAGLFDANTHVLNILALACTWAILAASWDLLSGYTGQISFGHAVFWGLAAYSSYWATTLFYDFDPVSGLLIGALSAAVLAFLLGIVALRVKGPYLALVTLMIPLIAQQLIVIFSELGGYYALSIPEDAQLVASVGNAVANYREVDALNFYFFALIMMFVCVAIIMFIGFSRYGLAFQSIREDEDAAESLGINLRFYKIFAFTLSAFFAGIAGVIFSNWLGSVDKSIFDAQFSFSVIIMVVIGGIGSIKGGVIGAFLLTLLIELFLKDVFRGVHGLEILAYGLLLVLTLRYMRFGLARASKEEKKAVVFGVLFAIAWIITIKSTIANADLLTLLGYGLMFIVSIPAIPIFLVSEAIGIFVINDIMGMALSSSALVKAKFLIFSIVGIPYAYYLPKAFKKVRLRFWGVWPSVGRYEPE